MSAWLELVESWQFHPDSMPFAEWLNLCSRAMAEIQTEQKRKDAAKIRDAAVGQMFKDFILLGADLIDPGYCPNGNNSMGPHGHTPNGDGEPVCTP